MKNVFTTSLAAAGLSVALLAAGPSFAEPPPGGHHRGPGNMIEHMADKLDLSDEQQTQIKTIFDQSKEAGEADRERLMELRQGLRANSDSFNASEVKAAADEIGAITSVMTYRRAETQYKVRQVLNDEQRAELDEMMEKGKERMKRHGKQDGKRGGDWGRPVGPEDGPDGGADEGADEE